MPWRRGDNSLLFLGTSAIVIAAKTNREDAMARIVYVDQEECIGCGTCEEICPEVFRLNTETEKAEVVDPSGAPEDRVEEAIEACPVECIHWKE
jgi:ferredoxin